MTLAMVFDRYGPPDVLRLAQLPDPQAGPGQVRVRVKAAGVQPCDVKLRSGAMAGFLPVSFPQTIGNEYAGVVDQVGDGLTNLAVGDAVLGSTMLSGYAQAPSGCPAHRYDTERGTTWGSARRTDPLAAVTDIKT